MDPVASLFSRTPELVNTPGLAADAITAGPDTGSGETLSLASTLNKVDEHVKKHKGWWDKFIPDPVQHYGGLALNTLAKPLHEVQHQYRYIHDVFESEGIGQGLLTLAPGLVAGTAGGFVGGGYGAIAGFEAATEVEGQLGLYSKSWERTKDGANYRDSNGHLVSPGRDLADLVNYVSRGHTANKQGQFDAYDLISGAGDAVFDLSFDPLMVAGKGAAVAKAAKFSPTAERTVLGAKLNPTKNLYKLGEDGKPLVDEVGNPVYARPGIHDTDMPADRVLEIYQNEPRVQDMVHRLASPEYDTEFILTNLPKLRPLAAELGKASTPDEVLNVFRDSLTTKNYSALSGGLPRTSITRRPIQARTQVKNAILNAGSKPVLDASGNQVVTKFETTGAEVPVEAANKFIRTFTSYRPYNVSDDLRSLSSKEMNLADDSSVQTMNQILRISQNARTANAITAHYANTKDITERINIYTNGLTDMLRAYGLKDDHELVTRWKGELQQMIDSTQKATYGLNWNGERILQEDAFGNQVNSGLLLNQQGKVALPNFNELRQALREDGNALQRLPGKVDDWTYEHYTTRFFKRFALLSLGFAFRVAAGELVPATLKYGGKVGAGALAAATEKFHPGLGALAADLGDDAILKMNGLRVSVDGLEPKGTFKGPDSEGYGVIQSVDKNAGTAQVKFGDEVRTHKLDELNAYHNDIPEKDIRLIARQAGIQLDKSEVGHVRAAVGKALYGVSKAVVDDDYRLMAHMNVLTNNGHMVAPALSPGHGEARVMDGPNSINMALKQINKQLPPNKRLGGDFSVFDGTEDLHELYWQNAIHEAAKDPGVVRGAQAYNEAVAAGLPEDAAKAAFIKADTEYMRAYPEYANKLLGAKTDMYQFSQRRAELFQGLTYSLPKRVPTMGEEQLLTRTHHRFVAEAIANGDAPNLRELSKVDALDRPIVKGRVAVDIPSESTLDKVVNSGFRKGLYPIINFLAREPIFTTAVTQEYKALKPFVDAGVMDVAQANIVAQQRAVPQMLPLIHNTELRNQFAEYTRNFLPFYYAQEQAYRRYATQIFSNPLAFERYRLATHAIHSSGIIQQDGSGQSYVVYPFLGGITDHLTKGAGALGIGVIGGVPSQVSGNISSLKSVVPGGLLGETEMPGVSPLAAISLKAIEGFFPGSEAAISEVIGPIAQNQGVTDSLVANGFIRGLIKATPFAERSRSFHTAFMFSIANASRRADELRSQAAQVGVDSREGQRLMAEADRLLPGPNADPEARQHAIDRIRNTTRIMFVARAVYGGTMPMAPHMEVGDFGLRKEVRQEVDKAKGDFAVGIQNFLDKHPDATADTVFLTDSKFLGTTVPAGKPALDWIRKNRGFIDSHALASAYLLPQGGEYDQEAYNLELAAGLRASKTPDEFVNSLYAAAGNAKFFPSLEAKKKAIAENPGAEKDINAQFRQYTMQLASSNPIWYRELNDPEKANVAHVALLQLRQVIADGTAPDSPQTQNIKELILSYDNYMSASAQLRAAGESSKDLRDQWDNFLTKFEADNPGSESVIRGVFRRLPNYEQSNYYTAA